MPDGRSAGDVRLSVFQRQQLLPVDRHVARRFDAQADFAPVGVNDRDADVFTDVDLLPELSAEDQHVATLLRAKQWLTWDHIEDEAGAGLLIPYPGSTRPEG